MEQDIAKAESLYRRAAEQNYGPAYYRLGLFYLNVAGSKDEKKALRSLRQGARLGDRQAIDLLASCYEKGVGVPKDKRAAKKIYALLKRGAPEPGPVIDALAPEELY